MSVSLSVNLNAIAYLRNRRDLPWPDLLDLGIRAMRSGASGLTVHPRPDERHIRFSDLSPLRALLDDEFPDGEFNIEGYPTDDFLGSVLSSEPDQVTLVPDAPHQSTSYFGWDYSKDTDFLRPIVSSLKQSGTRVALFTDVEVTQSGLESAASMGADRLELYTGPYGGCYDNPQQADIELSKLSSIADSAKSLGLGINAGHDLTIPNLPALVTALPDLLEVSIGHALTADMFIYGIEETVRLYAQACEA